MNNTSTIALPGNKVKDGDFSDQNSTPWAFEKSVPQSLSAREIDNGNGYFSASISGFATQQVSDITKSTLYTLTVSTKGSERQPDGQDRNPNGYLEIKADEVEIRLYVEGVHDWVTRKVRFRSSATTDNLRIRLFGSTGKLSFDNLSLTELEEVIGPDELIKNGYFNLDEEHWHFLKPNANAHAQVVLDGDNPCAQLSKLGSISQSVQVQLNKTYVLKFRAKASGGAVGDPGGFVSIKSGTQGGVDELVTVTNNWIAHTVEYTVPNVGGNDVLIVKAAGAAVSSNVTTLFDDFSLKLKV
ncbi:MAG TPA: hypothetical protein VN214_08320 [Pseudomonas sp.]|nr:hypothetical protein [Pseudomonas sp.]